MPEKPASADNTIARLGAVLAMLGGALAFLFNEWNVIEPVLMSPTGRAGWSLVMFMLGGLGYHFAVHSPVLARLAAAEGKLNRMTEEAIKNAETIGSLQGKMEALEETKEAKNGGR